MPSRAQVEEWKGWGEEVLDERIVAMADMLTEVMQMEADYVAGELPMGDLHWRRMAFVREWREEVDDDMA